MLTRVRYIDHVQRLIQITISRVLKPKLIAEVSRNYFPGKMFIFNQNSTPSHADKMTLELIF